MPLFVSTSVAAFGLATASASAGELHVDVRDIAGKSLTDAVAYMEALRPTSHPAPQTHRMQIDQVNKRFVPLVSLIQTGTEVSFPNSDNIQHSIYSFSPAKTFTIRLYSGKQASPIVFDAPGLVVLGCNIHDNMIAWVVVVDTPYFAKTGVDGVGVIKELESGDYRLSVWYPGPQFHPHVAQIHIAEPVERYEVRLDTSDSSLPAVGARAQGDR
jgi:plastocyanin